MGGHRAAYWPLKSNRHAIVPEILYSECRICLENGCRESGKPETQKTEKPDFRETGHAGNRTSGRKTNSWEPEILKTGAVGAVGSGWLGRSDMMDGIGLEDITARWSSSPITDLSQRIHRDRQYSRYGKYSWNSQKSGIAKPQYRKLGLRKTGNSSCRTPTIRKTEMVKHVTNNGTSAARDPIELWIEF